MTLIAELGRITVDRTGRRVLDDVSLQVDATEVVAVLGPNGAGKSTMVRAMVGLQPLTSGHVRLFGTPLRRFRDWSRVGWVPQRTTAAAGVPATVREVVTTGRLSRVRRGRRMRQEDLAAVENALAVVGLTDRSHVSVSQLSGGQQQRVLIARALACSPDLLVLDEPTAGVDAESQDAFTATLQHLTVSGTTVVLVAHELGPLAALVSKAVVLRDGRVAYEGSPPPAEPHHDHPQHDHVHPHADETTASLLKDLWMPS